MMSPRVTGQKRRGRPKKSETLSFVATRLPAAAHDRLIERARVEDKSVSAFLRDFIVKHFSF
jgi:hypothetical protein